MTAILRGATLALIGFSALFFREAFQSECFEWQQNAKTYPEYAPFAFEHLSF